MVIGRVSNPFCVSREIRKSPVVVEPLTSGPQPRFARASAARPEPRSGDATSPSQEVPSVGILGTPRHRSPDDCRPQHDHGVARPPQVPDADAAPRFPLILRDERQMLLVWGIAQATVTGRGATGGASRPVKHSGTGMVTAQITPRGLIVLLPRREALPARIDRRQPLLTPM